MGGRAVKPGASREVNQVISFWQGEHNVGVLSSTSAEFIESLRRWAKKSGIRVEPVETEES